MSTLSKEAGLEVEMLATRLLEVHGTYQGAEGLFAPQTLFDVNVPAWRFQLQGPDAFVSWLAQVAPGGMRSSLTRTLPTVSGFVVEMECWDEGKDLYARSLILCEVEAGQITEVTWYCSGWWDAETRARQAAEAPLIRP